MTMDFDRMPAPVDDAQLGRLAGGSVTEGREGLVVPREAVSGFAHRLRSLLTCVGAAAEYPLLQGDDPEVGTEMLTMIVEQVNKIHALLDDFLVVVEDHGRTPAQQEVDLNVLARQVVRALAAEAQTVGAWLVLDATEPVPAVWGDTQALHQALTGSVRFMLCVARRGERVVIALTGPQGGDSGAALGVTVSLQADADTAARRARALVQGDLTLDAVRRIIEAHGGDLQVLTEAPGLHWSLPAQPVRFWSAAALAR